MFSVNLGLEIQNNIYFIGDLTVIGIQISRTQNWLILKCACQILEINGGESDIYIRGIIVQLSKRHSLLLTSVLKNIFTATKKTPSDDPEDI